MGEEIGTGFGRQTSHELAGSSMQRLFGALGAFAQEGFEHAIGFLDRVEVRRIRRQIAQACAGGFDRFTYACDLMGGDIVHDDNVAALKRWRQALLDIGHKDCSIHGAMDHHGCGHAIATQPRHEGQCFPHSEGHPPGDPFAFGSAAMQTGHVGVDRCLIDETKAGRIKKPLLAYPAPAGAGDVGPLLLGSVQDFF